MNHINTVKIDRNFYLSEFQCPCCNLVMIHSKLLKLLVKLRNKIAQPIYINSGYRCEKENENVGGVLHSYHRLGMAADIYVRNMKTSDLLIYARMVGFMGIGFYPTFLHLDVRPVKSYWEG